MLKLYLLCVLGFCLSGVSDAANSTQVLFVKLTVEESVISNVSDTLLNKDYGFDNYTLYDLKKTTECDPLEKTCSCEDGFEWSPDACSSEAKCCGTGECESTEFSCISNSTVNIIGSLTLTSQYYHRCLDDKASDKFKKCNKNLTTTIKTFYSQIYGFHRLTITNYKVGSVIAEFAVVVMSNKLSDLKNTSTDLSAKLNATLNLETQGVVQLEVPQGQLAFGTKSVTLSCSLKTEQELSPDWELKNYLNEIKDIHNGTQSTITQTAQASMLELKDVSLLWTGRYTCSYKQHQSHVVIRHKASAYLDICAEAKISASTSPGFPRCLKNSDLVSVIVNCEVEQTYEEYDVAWGKKDIDAQIIEKKLNNTLGMIVFSAQTFVSCTSKKPTVTCNITNRCNQLATKEVKIIMIKANEKHCNAEGDWMDTKAGATAVIKCLGSVGIRKRPCNEKGIWGNETSSCVNRELQGVLSKATICDIGQGTVVKNAWRVFSDFKSVTNNTKAINSPANLETSVNVIRTMKTKPEITSYNETTVNDFLRSSSNLMNPSLESSWTRAAEQNDSKHLAEDYLSSVEEMIDKVDIKKQTKNPNLEVVSCNLTETALCHNRVFNNNVTLDSPGATSIKTAGFLYLDRYLPNKDNEFSPNSIVISTTWHSENKDDPVKIHIDFKLERPRPRNTEVKCVFWNNETHDWSGEGCKLVSSADMGSCECNHLSAFAILMSKAPLEVPYLSEVTYAGLSVSIVSLIICLAVELILWRDVVKTDTLHLRHCAHVNISVCLLVGDVCFLASQLPGELSEVWCKTFVVVEHFCFLAMFFWMLCLSSILLHKTVYLSLHGVSKTAYLRFSIILGYVCPLLIVVITFLANNGEEGRYYSKDTRWLIYNGTLKGSIFTFILPVGIIVFVNVFFMCLVIMRLLQPVKAAQRVTVKERNSAKTVIRSVILLTPVFGLTWGFGFLVTLVDLTSGVAAFAVNYIFTIMNAFQGLYIFLTTCVGDRMVRDGLRRYFQKKVTGVSTLSSSVDQSCKEDDNVKK